MNFSGHKRSFLLAGPFKIICLLSIPAIFLSLWVLPAHPSANAPKWTFATLSDSQMGNWTFKKILLSIRKDPSKPELILHCGDLIGTPGNQAQWDTVLNILKILEGKIPLYLTPGNHDVNGRNSQITYIDKIKPPGGKTYYSIEHKNALFIALDANMPGEQRKISSWQRKWFVETLKSRDPEKHRWTFVFFHMPIFPQGLYKKINQPLLDGMSTHKILRDYHVTAVFTGHEHMYNHTFIDNVHYFINGGAGGRLYKGWGGEFHHWIRVTVTDNKVFTEAIDLNGKVRDRQTIKKSDTMVQSK